MLALGHRDAMKLFLFGVMHASPVCRDRYLSRLRTIFLDQGTPAFVAVEAAPRLFRETILPQRTEFRDLAMADSQFTHYGTPFIDALAKCLGFEADAHTEIYGQPGPAIIWLDEHRDEDENDHGFAPSYGLNYYHWFKNWIGQDPCPTVQGAFSRIHDGINCSSQGPSLQEAIYRRDAIWADRINERIERCSPDDHAIVTVGLDHLGKDPRSVLSRLIQVAKCEAIDLTME